VLAPQNITRTEDSPRLASAHHKRNLRSLVSAIGSEKPLYFLTKSVLRPNFSSVKGLAKG